MYKFIQPGNSGASRTAEGSAARKTLFATNRLGGSISGLANTVNNLEKIYKASAKNEKLVEIAERRREKRERDLAREEEIESQNLGKGTDAKEVALKAQKTKNPFGSGLKDRLLGGFAKILTSILGFFAKLYVLKELPKILDFFENPQKTARRAAFIADFKLVFDSFASFGKKLAVDGIIKPFNKLINGNTFKDKLEGLGKLVMGLAGLTVLLNPFGTMDAILSLLGLDFYRDRTDEMRNKNKGKNRTNVKDGKVKLKTKVKIKNAIKTPNGKKLYNEFKNQINSKTGKPYTDAEALKRVNRIVRQRPEAFQPPPRQVRPNAPAPTARNLGNITRRGLNKSFGRGALKFLGKTNVKLLGKAFQNTFGRIPVFGTLLTAAFSVLSGDPWKQTLFKTAGAGIGGALGTLLPIPGVGTILGTMLGEYVGDLLYTGFSGKPDGGWKEVGKRLKEDIMGILSDLGKMMVYIKNSFGRFYEGLPKIKIPDFPKDPPAWIPKWVKGRNLLWKTAKISLKAMMGPYGLMMGRSIPNVLWMANPMNSVKLLHQSFFKPFERPPKGQEEEGTAIVGVKGDDDKSKDSTSGTSSSGGDKSKYDDGYEDGYEDGKKGVEYKGELGIPVTKEKKKRTDKGPGYQNQWWDVADLFPNKKKTETEKQKPDYETVYKGELGIPTTKKKTRTDQGEGYKNQWWDFLDVFGNKKIEEKVSKPVGIGPLADGNAYAAAITKGTSGIGPVISGDTYGKNISKPKPAVDKKKKPWWRFGFEEGGELGPPHFLFGFVKRVFRGVTNVVKSVVSTVSNVVGKVAQVAMPILSVAAPFIPALAPIMPFMQAANAVNALRSGNVMGAISGGLGALGGFFPGTFGAQSAFGKFMSGNPIGQAIGGFMTGGVQGALGSLTSFLPQGFQNFLGGIGGFMNKFPSIGGLINGIPGLGGILGSFGVTGIDGGGFSPMSLFGDIANQMGFGSIFKTVTGMLQGGGMHAVMDGLREMAPELGVIPEALGVFTAKGKNARNNLLDSRQSQMSKAYAMQSQLEFVPMPVIIEKLTPISRAIPIGQ